AKFERLAVRLVDAEPPRHAEMHDQHLAVVEAREQVFGTPVECLDSPALEAVGETYGQRKAQIAAPLLDARETIADKDRLEAQTHRFDLRQLRHEDGTAMRNNPVAVQ